MGGDKDLNAAVALRRQDSAQFGELTVVESAVLGEENHRTVRLV